MLLMLLVLLLLLLLALYPFLSTFVPWRYHVLMFLINALPNVLACRINRVCPWNGPGQPGPVA